MLSGALDRHVTFTNKDAQLYLARYISYKPSKSFMGFGGSNGDSVNTLIALTSDEILIIKEN